MTALAGFRFREIVSHGLRRRGGGHISGSGERDEHGATFDLRVVAHRPRELEHHARAIAGLRDVDTPQIALGDFRKVNVLAERLAAVTAEDVARVVSTYLRAEHRTIVIAEPDGDDEEAE